MHNDPSQNGERLFPPQDMINASELREFLFCERAWFLSRQGFRVSAQAQAQRAAGIEFHEARAGAASRGRSPWIFWLALILAGASLAILLFQLWRGSR
jgi:hypothetical protein